jgi:polyhydroxyalkanoate synthesis regulator phasin
MAYRPERGWGISHQSAAGDAPPAAQASEIEELRRRVAELETRQRTGVR